MPAPIRESGTMTSKGQTTVPKSARQTLGLAPGEAFLDLLARDIAAGRNLGELPKDLAAALTSAAAAEVDPDEPIDGDTVL